MGDYPKLYGIDINDGQTLITLILPDKEAAKAKSLYPLGSVITVEIESITEWKVIKDGRN